MLVALRDGERVEAAGAIKGPAYVCPECKGAVILKQGTRKVEHFAHKPPSCEWGKGETAEHMGAKLALQAAFRVRGLRAEVEWPVLSSGGNRRADVVVWSPTGKLFAFEVQHQPIEPDEIARRTEAYLAARIPVVWISLHRDRDLWRNVIYNGPGALWIEKYSVRPWERWAHGYHMGSLWFYRPKDQTFWSGRLEDFLIEVPSSEWYDSDGNENSSGGYTRVAKK